MDLFIKDDTGDLVINDTYLAVPEFKRIWERDDSKKKAQALKEFMYIYQKNHPKSPYQSYDQRLIETKVINDFIQDPEWQPDEFIKIAEKRYIDEFLDSPAIRFAKSIKVGLDKISEFIINKPVNENTMGKILSAISKGEETLEKYNKVQRIAEEQMEKDLKKKRAQVAVSKTLT